MILALVDCSNSCWFRKTKVSGEMEPSYKVTGFCQTFPGEWLNFKGLMGKRMAARITNVKKDESK